MQKNCNITLPDSVRGYDKQYLTVSLGENCTPLASSPEYCINTLEGKPLNANVYMFGAQNFQAEHSQQAFLGENTGYDPHFLMLRGLSALKPHQEYASIDSPTLTANSERSEITEVSTDFSFLGSQKLVGQQQLDSSQSQLMQQSAYNDMQLLQQQMMFKQIQEIQRQQQLQQFDVARQQSSQNQIAAFTRQSAGGQYPSYINGTSVSDSSQIFMNRAHQGASSATQGALHQLMFPQEKGNSFHSNSTLVVPHQVDESNARTPSSSERDGIGQYSQLQGMNRDSGSVLTKASGQSLNPSMNPAAFSSPSFGHQNTVSSDHFALSQIGRSKAGFQEEQISIHGLDAGVQSINIQQKHSIQTSLPFPEFRARQDGVGWLGNSQQKTTQLETTQYFAPLDPIEQKILYNMDHNMWDSSRSGEMNNVSFENNLEHSDYANVFPSLQSGSWSALMQSAVAEASSSDTGIQEEWSGLTFQNTEPSTENQHSNIVDSKKEQSAWFENNLSASSLSSRPYPNFNDSSLNSCFPGFQQSGIHSPLEQVDNPCQEDSHDLNQNPSEKTGGWLNSKSVEKRLGDETQHVQTLGHLNNNLASQIYEQSGYKKPHQPITSHEISNRPRGPVNEVTHNQGDSRGCSWKADNDIRHLENIKHVNISSNNVGDEIMRAKHRQLIDVPVPQNSYERVGDPFLEKLQQRENSHDHFNLKQMTSQGQGPFEQSYYFDVSSNPMNFEKGQLTGFQRNLKPSDDSPRGNLDSCTNFSKSIDSSRSNLYNQTSENVHGPLQNVDQSKANGTIPYYSTVGSTPLSMMTETVFPDAPISQQYSQSPKQVSTMRLPHPPQQLSYSNKISSPHFLSQLSSNSSTRPINPGFAERNQTLLASQSRTHSMPPTSVPLHNVPWNEKSNFMEQTEAASALFTPSHFAADENQMLSPSSAPVVCLSPQTSLPSTVSKNPQFDLAYSQDTSQYMNSNNCGKQYPVLETQHISHPLAMSRMGQQSGFSSRQQNVWSNNTSQHHYFSLGGNEKGTLNNTLEATPSAIQGFNDQNSPRLGVGLLESDMISTTSQEYQHKNEIPEQKTKSDLYDNLLGGGVARKVTNTNTFSPGLLLVHPHQQDLNRMQIVDGNGLATSHRNSRFDNFSKLPHIVSQQKAKPLMNEGTDPKGVLYAQQISAALEENTTRENLHCGQGSTSELSPLPSDNRKLNLLTRGIGDDKVSPLNMFQRDFTSDNGNEIQDEFNRKNMEDNIEKSSQINSLEVPSWFKFRNERMPPMYNELCGKHLNGRASLLKPSENLCKHSSLDGKDSADVNQSGRVWSNAATNMVATDPLSIPYGLPSAAAINSVAITRPKKRKSEASELQPWHLEVRGFKRVANFSTAEQDWAHTTNRLTEKMEKEVELVEDGYGMFRSKRRLVLTTRLLQQLVCPAPSFFLSADASSFHDSVVYFMLRSSLGDACSLMRGKRNDLQVSHNRSNIMIEEVETEKIADDNNPVMILEKFSARAVKLENDFQRLDRTASVIDLLVECQELERFSVINRFAKFHIRQVEPSGNLSSNGLVTLAPKSCPQRYVTAQPAPRHLPEGVQCLSI